MTHLRTIIMISKTVMTKTMISTTTTITIRFKLCHNFGRIPFKNIICIYSEFIILIQNDDEVDSFDYDDSADWPALGATDLDDGDEDDFYYYYYSEGVRKLLKIKHQNLGSLLNYDTELLISDAVGNDS